MNNGLIPYEGEDTSTKRYLSQLDRFVQNIQIKSNGLPAHIALAMSREDLTVPKRMKMLGTYETADIVKCDRFLNRVVTILGCTVFEHGPYTGMDGEEHPGYSYLLIKTNLTTNKPVVIDRVERDIKVPVVIKVSGQFIDPFFLGQIVMDRAMDFKEPIKVWFTGSQSSGYRCSVIDDLEIADTLDSMSESNSYNG